jgi:cytochrome c peroxidase
MPTLRNVAERPAYMHNGVFKDLETVIRFYSTRNSNPQFWYGKAESNDLPAKYLKNIEVTKAPLNRPADAGPALSDSEIAAIIAFLKTLSDR